jgi:hypothetical protein
MARSKSGNNRFLGWRGTCAAAAIGVLCILLLPRSCGEEFVNRWGGGSGSGDATASARIPTDSEPGTPEDSPVATVRSEAGALQPPGPALSSGTGTDLEGQEANTAPSTSSRRTVPGRSGQVRAANRPVQSDSPSRKSYSFSAAPRGATGGWAEEHRYIRQGEFAILLLEAIRLPRPPQGWQPEIAACTLSANVGCGGQPTVALRRQSPFPDEFEDEGAFRSPAADWIGERTVMPSAGWRVHEFLTEGEMVEVLGQMGIQMYSAEPEKLVSWKLARRVLGKFQGLLVPMETMVA